MPSLVIHSPTMSSWTNREITNHHLLPYVDSETATPEVAQALHTLPFQRNIFKLLANAPAMMPAFMKLLSTCWSEERTIRSKEWQIAVLRTAWLNNAPYEWDVNEPVAACFGLEDDDFRAIREGDFESGSRKARFNDRQRIVLVMINELEACKEVKDLTLTKAVQLIGESGVMEVLMIHGVYSLLARVMKSCKIDFDNEIPGLAEKLRAFNARRIQMESEQDERCK